MPSIAVDTGSAVYPASRIRVLDLLRHSPVYTDDCDLYPQRMREVLNQRRRVIVANSGARTAQAQQQQQPAVVAGSSLLSRADIESLLRLYPGAARHLQI